MATGMLVAPPGQIIVGRDPSRASLVIQHPSVSSQHATVILDRMAVIDHSSTSGTYVGPTRIPAGTPTPIEAGAILAFGPVPVQVQLLVRLGQAPRVPLGIERHHDVSRASGGAAGAARSAAAQVGGQAGARAGAGRTRGRGGRQEEQDRPRPARLRARGGRGEEHRPHAGQRHRHLAPAGVEPARAAPPHRGAALRRGSRQRQRHLRARPPHRPRAEGAGPERGEDLHRPHASADRAERERRRRDRPGGVRRRSLGRAAPSTRSRPGACCWRCPTATTPPRDEGAARQRVVQGAPRRHDRADGPLGRGQDHAAPRPQRLSPPVQRHRPHQRGGPLQHLRQPPRIHRLRPPGRPRPRRADRLRGGQVQRHASASRPTTATRRSTPASSRPSRTWAWRA